MSFLIRSDVLELINMIKKTVYDKFQVSMLGSEGDATVLLADMAAFTGEGMSDAQLHGFLSSAFTTLLGFYETAEERLSALVIRREGDY